MRINSEFAENQILFVNRYKFYVVSLEAIFE